MTSSISLRLKAPAKVNLALEVLGRRSDGYHEVRTVLQAIGLADELRMERAEAISLEVVPPGAVSAEANLVLAAAALLREETGLQAGARIRLHKRIPVSAGLGGGSSDAAATLLGLRRLWGLDLTEARLLGLAARLGSDVPFFIRGGAALGSGRGEELTALPTPKGLWAVVLAPSDAAGEGKTARLYGLLTLDHYSAGGARSEELVRRVRSGEPLAGALFNVFDGVGDSAYPRLASARDAFRTAGAGEAHLAGAGPSLFALARGGTEARRLRDRLIEQGYTAHAAPFLQAWGLEGASPSEAAFR